MLSDVVIVAAIGGAALVVSTAIPAYLIYRTKQIAEGTQAAVEDVSHRMDGRLDQALKLSTENAALLAFAAGVKQETDKKI
jgi:hypothetical protein